MTTWACPETFQPSMSEDEFDQHLDLFLRIDWSSVPELSNIPPVSQHGALTSDSILIPVGPRPSTPLANGWDSSLESMQYLLDKWNDSFNEWDALLLDKLSKVEQRVLQLQKLAEGPLPEDRGKGTSNGKEFLLILLTTDVVPYICWKCIPEDLIRGIPYMKGPPWRDYIWGHIKNMARLGIEPRTYWIYIRCSTNWAT